MILDFIQTKCIENVQPQIVCIHAEFKTTILSLGFFSRIASWPPKDKKCEKSIENIAHRIVDFMPRKHTHIFPIKYELTILRSFECKKSLNIQSS